LIVVFDADHAPRHDFSREDARLFRRCARVCVCADAPGLLQPGLVPASAGSNASHENLDRAGACFVFFASSNAARIGWNSAFPFAAAARWSARSSLERIGGFATGTITEDLHTSNPPARGRISASRISRRAACLRVGNPSRSRPFRHAARALGSGAPCMCGAHRGHRLQFRPELGNSESTTLASVATYFDGWTKGLFYFAPRRGAAHRMRAAGGPRCRRSCCISCRIASSPSGCSRRSGAVTGRTVYIEQYNMARLRGFCLGNAGRGFFPNGRFEVTRKRSRGATACCASRWRSGWWWAATCSRFPSGSSYTVTRTCYRWPAWQRTLLWAGHQRRTGAAAVPATYAGGANGGSARKYRFRCRCRPEARLLQACGVHGTIDNLSEGTGMRFYGGLLSLHRVGQ